MLGFGRVVGACYYEDINKLGWWVGVRDGLARVSNSKGGWIMGISVKIFLRKVGNSRNRRRKTFKYMDIYGYP